MEMALELVDVDAVPPLTVVWLKRVSLDVPLRSVRTFPPGRPGVLRRLRGVYRGNGTERHNKHLRHLVKSTVTSSPPRRREGTR